ncbi:HNH endonuclease signature motif containing protein [Micromonospora peucetia]|uniref:HNH endonuclease n=1 Tax=Micromonospora peucetia TaxID=47871 RepID=UPI003322B120
MIKLRKGPQPAVLSRNGEPWKAEYQQALAAGKRRSDIPARYRHPEIKEAVRAESFDKCLYCETKISHAQFGDVEHIVPISAKPEDVVTWENLGYVCQVCNNKKRDYWDESCPLLNPYHEDPNDHILFLGPWVMHRPGDERGRVTARRLHLNRSALMERRKERLDRIAALLDEIALMPPGPAKTAMLEYLREETSKSTEYSGAASALVSIYLHDGMNGGAASTHLTRPSAEAALSPSAVDSGC